MKLVEAVWEKRNLGVLCNEITITEEDTAESVKEKIPAYETEYTVVKVPAGRVDIMFALSDMGFYFVECSIKVSYDVKKYALQGMQKRLVDAVAYASMEQDDIEQLFDEIRKGLFTTDRIFLDPHFSKEDAANRYIGWISDELKRNTSIYKLLYKNETVGFFALKDLGEGVYYPFLSAIYPDSSKTGLGISSVFKPVEEVIKRNGRMIESYLSSNNSNAMHNIAFGLQICESSYVYVKHRS